VKDPSHLNEREQQMIGFFTQELMIQQAYQLSQSFLTLLNQQQGEQDEGWIGTCSTSGVSELEDFAFNSQRDVTAMITACTMPYSNGPTQGIIHRLKCIKRCMYGRGSYDSSRKPSFVIFRLCCCEAVWGGPVSWICHGYRTAIKWRSGRAGVTTRSYFVRTSSA
jgi:hypothetical protein